MKKELISKLRNFSKLSFQSKVKISKKGRPIPDLKNLLQTTGRKKVNRSFHKEWHTRKEWLCGCALRNRFFCYPCLLFSTSDNVWIKTGFCDLKNLPRSLSKHEKSNIRIQSQISFKTFETSRINRRDGVVVRASATQSVDQGFIPLVESYQKTLKNGIYSFPAWRSAFRGGCGEQAGKFACYVLGQGTQRDAPSLCRRQVTRKWQLPSECGLTVQNIAMNCFLVNRG